MKYLGRALAALVAVCAGACVKLDSFTCAQSSECQNGDVAGLCEPGGVCSFPDPMCPSGKKFGDLAGDQSGQCVDASGTTGGDTTSPTTTVGPTTFDPGTTSDADATTFELTSTSTPTSTTQITGQGTSTTDTTQTSEPDTTTGATCGAVGGACVDGTCCGACSTCKDDMCIALAPERGPQQCGSDCSACGDDGECHPAPAGTECNTNCSDAILTQDDDGPNTACYGYGAKPAVSACDDAGTCLPPDPVAAGCPDPMSDPKSVVELALCSTACLKAADLCMPGKPASAVTLETYCVLNDITDLCRTTCTDDALSVNEASCDGVGVCVHPPFQSCNGYFCDDATTMCKTSCQTNAECVEPLVCESSICQ